LFPGCWADLMAVTPRRGRCFLPKLRGASVLA
jgi:hypothetical protein